MKAVLVPLGWKISYVNLAVMMAEPKSTNNYQQTYQKSADQSSNLWMLLALGIIFVTVGILNIIFLTVKAIVS